MYLVVCVCVIVVEVGGVCIPSTAQVCQGLHEVWHGT